MSNETITFSVNGTSTEDGGDENETSNFTMLVVLGSMLVGMSGLCMVLMCALCVFAVMACRQAKDGYVNTNIQDDFSH